MSIRQVVMLVVAVVAWFWFSGQSALAADLNDGARVFSANCAACHMGGGNVVNAAKTLKRADLEKFEMASVEAIQAQVTKGKNAMPSFLGRLTDEEIENVAAYVLAQSEQGW